MRPWYRNWPRWTKVYFAGSEAAKWQPFNGDFDVLLGADFDTFRKENPEYADQPDDAIAKMITDGMWHTINVDGYWFTLADGRKVGPFDRTFFMSDRAWDIRNLKPYAAYNVTDDEWAVHPLEVPKDWDATHLPESYWTYAEAVLNEIKAIGTLPPEERHRMAANLWEELHTHRSDAFTGDGKGLFDLSNVIEKYLDQHPDKPWAQLVQWKNQSPSGSQPWVPTTARRTILTMLFDAKTKEPEGADYDGIMVAIVPPKSVGRKLLVEEGEPLEALHVTLVYLGDSSEYTRDQMKELGPLVRAWARTQKPLTARIGGAGTFHNVGEHVLWASVDIPGGGGVRHSLSELLEEHGYNVRNDHGWTPHITLKYHKHPVRFLPKVEPESWDVNEIMLCVGDEWMPVALGS
jgi:2'-5' RNA ligase